MKEQITGGCFCGAVRYEAAGLSSAVGYCHCETCRRTHSAPFMASALTPYDGFKWTKGADMVAFIESSPGKRRHFCPKCGTHMAALYPGTKHAVLRVCSLDDGPPSTPVVHIWYSDKADWFELDECAALPRLPEGAPKR